MKEVPARRILSFLPGLLVLRSYDRKWLRHDLFAGLALTAFLVPVGMGYAQAAGLPPITGLYATVFPLLAYALFGPSRVMVLGPDSSLAAVIAAIVIPLAAGNVERTVFLAATLALVTGIVIAAAGLSRLGFVTELLSRPVQLGYLTGVALHIVVGQAPTLFGCSVSGDSLPEDVAGFVRALRAGEGNTYSVALGGLAIAVIALGRWLLPKAPGSLVAVVLGIVAVEVLGLADEGVQVLGKLPQGLPSLAVPDVSLGDVWRLVPGAIGIALVAIADTTVLSQSLAFKRREEVEPDQELVALGTANVASGLFGGFAISSSSSRTPVAIAAGAKSQLTGVVGALAIVLLISFAPELLQSLPKPVLAGVVLVAAFALVDLAAIRRLYATSRPEFALWLTGFVSVALIGVLEGIFLTVLLSLGDFVRRAWRPHDAVLGRVDQLKGYHDVTRFPDARRIPGLLLYRFDAPLFFANARHFRARVRELVAEAEPPVKWVAIVSEPITDIDSTAVAILKDLHEELKTRGVVLVVAELKDPVKDRLRAHELYDVIGDGQFFPTVGTAVDAYLAATGVAWKDWED
jgi:high affinity sulfate transporter 1